MDQTQIDNESDVKAVDTLVEKYHALRNEIGKVIVGQDDVIQEVLISVFSRGHCLLIGVPGFGCYQLCPGSLYRVYQKALDQE